MTCYCPSPFNTTNDKLFGKVTLIEGGKDFVKGIQFLNADAAPPPPPNNYPFIINMKRRQYHNERKGFQFFSEKTPEWFSQYSLKTFCTTHVINFPTVLFQPSDDLLLWYVRSQLGEGLGSIEPDIRHWVFGKAKHRSQHGFLNHSLWTNLYQQLYKKKRRSLRRKITSYTTQDMQNYMVCNQRNTTITTWTQAIATITKR